MSEKLNRVEAVRGSRQGMKMTNYREILRIKAQGFSQRSIAASVGCARSTVERVLERAKECKIIVSTA